MPQPINHEFKREEVLGSYWVNVISRMLNGVRTDLRLSLKSATDVQIVPDAELGAASITIQGRWRFNEATISRSHPGGAKGTFSVWAVAKDNEVDNTPKPFTDHTDYSFDLRITKGEEAPSGSGVVIYEKIGEIDWSGTEIEALRQTHGSVTGPMIEATALSSEAPSDITWTRAANGGLIAGLKANSVGATELADESVDTNALLALAVTTAKIAAEAITAAKLGPESVETAKVKLLAVTTALLAAKAVTEGKIGDEAVNTTQIKALAVTAAKLAAEAVTSEKVGALAITEAKLAAEAVGTGKIANLAVTEAKIAAEAVATSKIKDLAVTAAKLAAEAVETAKIKDLAVTEAKIADGAVTDAKLASPNNSVYRQLLVLSGGTLNEMAAGTYYFSKEGPVVSGANTGTPIQVPVLYLNKADYEVAGKTQKLRLRAQVGTNATKPAVKFTFGLYPVTTAGTPTVLALTLGTVVAGSTQEFNEPVASTITSGVTADFTVPSLGAYVLGVAISAKLTAGSAAFLTAQLQTRSV